MCKYKQMMKLKMFVDYYNLLLVWRSMLAQRLTAILNNYLKSDLIYSKRPVL